MDNEERAEQLVKKYGFNFERISKSEIIELIETEINNFQEGSSEYIRLLCGYLYCIGDMSDAPLIKKVKYGINFDVECMIDVEWIENLEDGDVENRKGLTELSFSRTLFSCAEEPIYQVFAYRGMGSIDFYAVAKRLLIELAETNNMMLSSEILELATEEDISKRTMETAKKELGIEDCLPEIKSGLEQKYEAIMRRELYTKSKTAKTQAEREEARKEYLDKVGMHRDFRW